MNSSRARAALASLPLVLVVGACGGAESAEPELPKSTFGSSQATGTVVLQEDFSTVDADWIGSAPTPPGVSAEIAHDALQVVGEEPSGYSLNFAELEAGDGPSLDDLEGVRFELDTSIIRGGSSDTEVTLQCRVDPQKPRSSGYSFTVWADGFYRVDLETGRGPQTLSRGHSDFLESMQRRLAIQCAGDALTMWTNGVPVAVARDSAYDRGTVGVRVANGKSAFEVDFDNVTIIELDED